VPSADLLTDLAAVTPANALVTDVDVLETYRHDQAAWVTAGKPVAAVFPTTTREVQAIVRAVAGHRVPIVARGAGSGLSGGAAAVDGCVIVSLERMNRVLQVQPDDQTICVEPGVLNAEVTAAVRGHGLWYPPDPASKAFSTIGGNIATNAGGLCCVKYGVTADYVLGLQVVLADGSVVETGRRTVKGVSGLNLTALFVGSEGTLGIVTAARLRLRSAPAPASTVVAFFSSTQTAGRAVRGLTASRVVPALLEVMDHTTVLAVDDWKRMGLDRDAAVLLLAQSDAPGTNRGDETDAITRVCEEAGATYVAKALDADEGEQLLAARRLAYPALERLGATLLDDVAVPRSRIPDLLAVIESVAEKHGVLIGTFGHAGDGNMHPTIVFDRDNEASRHAAAAAFDDLVVSAIELGGTISGEHGVGTLKHRFLERELGTATVALQRRVKNAVDPLGILNPGKAV